MTSFVGQIKKKSVISIMGWREYIVVISTYAGGGTVALSGPIVASLMALTPSL